MKRRNREVKNEDKQTKEQVGTAVYTWTTVNGGEGEREEGEGEQEEGEVVQ